MKSQEIDSRRLADLISEIKFAMLTTINSDGSLHSRPMANQEIDVSRFDGRLWFFTKKDTFKVFDIQNDRHVNLAYSNPTKQKYISITGTAKLSEDKELMKNLWSPDLKAWFPEGLNDPQMVLIKIQVESAEIWDTPPSKIVQLVGMFKAAITGIPYDDKKHSEHIQLQH